MKEAEFDLLFEQSSPGLSVTDLDTGISEDEFNSLFQGTQIGLPEEEEGEIVEETLQLGPAVPEQYPTIDRPVVERPIADPGDVATGRYPFSPPQVNLPSDTIVEDPSVQNIIPPGLESALPWTQPSKTPLFRERIPTFQEQVPGSVAAGAVQAAFPDVPDQMGEPSILTELLPSLEAGYERTKANVLNLLPDLAQYREENPWVDLAEKVVGVGGGLIPPRPISDEDKARMRAEAQKSYRKSIEIGRPLSFGEVEDVFGERGFVNYMKGLIGSSAPQMAGSILSLGTMSPLLLSAEMNKGMEDIEGLTLKEKIPLVKAGGLIAAAFENIGLGVLFRGIPKEVLAKVGMSKIAGIMESSIARRIAGRGIATSLTEAGTETLQDGTFIMGEYLAGKDFKPGEIKHRLKEAGWGGLFLGGGLGGGGKAITETVKKVGEITPNTGFSLEDSGKEDDGLSRPYIEAAIREAAELAAMPKTPSEIAEEKFTKSIEEVTPEVSTEEAVEAFDKYMPEKKVEKIPLGIRKKGGDPAIESEEEVTPESQSSDVSTPQAEVTSPPGVQESTNPLDYLKDETFINTYPDATINSIKAQVKKAKAGDILGGGTVESEVTEEQKEEIIEWIDQHRRPREQRPEEDGHWKEILESEKKRELDPEHGYDEQEKKSQIESIQKEIQKGSAKVEEPVAEVGWEDYKNSKGKVVSQVKKVGEGFGRNKLEEGRFLEDGATYIRKFPDGKFKVSRYYREPNTLQSVSSGQLKVNKNEFATEAEALEAAKNVIEIPVIQKKPVVEETPDLETGWQEYKNAKGKTLAHTKKIGDTKRGDDIHPVVVKKDKAGIFRVAEFWGSELLNLSPSQLLKNNYGGDIDNVPGGLLNKFATEEEATEAAKNFLREPVKEVVEKPKPELPKVEVKEEAVVEQQPIQANPEAKEGDPGFKRKAIPGTNTEVITPDSSMKVGTTYKIVELSELLQAEGEFQNRDRSREQSADLVRERAAMFDPAQVIEPSRTSESGPPIVLPSGVIVSGNGRVLTIKELYENPEYAKQKEEYQMALFTKYKQPGAKNPFVTVDGGVIKQPVLVQQLNTAKLAKDDASRVKRIVKFVNASNISKVDTMSAGERAKSDVKGTKKIISLFKGSDITSDANRPFVSKFVEENVPSSERGEFFTEGSELSNSGLKRIQAALLTAAFGENKSITKLLESTDNDVKAITNAMLNVSPKYVEVSAGIDKDLIPREMDLTPYLIKALDKISTLRQEGIKPAGDFAQVDFLAEPEEIRDMFVRAFYHDDMKKARSSKFINNVLRNFVDKILKQDYTKGLPGLEAEAKTASATELLDQTVKEIKTEEEGGLFATDEAPPSIETKERTQDASKKERVAIPPDEAPSGVGQGSGRGRTKTKPARRIDAAKKESGKGINQWTNPEFNASAREQIFFDLAMMDETMAESLSIEERIGIIKNLEPKKLDQLLRRMVKNKFGLKYVLKESDDSSRPNEAALVDSINNMINAYHNMQGMAAVLGLPLKALGLEGTLGLRSEGPGGRTRANAFFQSSNINDPLGPPYITIKGRFNAFAHEWGHALDYFLLDKLGQDWSRGMSNRLRGKSIIDEETEERIEPWQATDTAERIKYAFGDLLNAMFQEEGDTAAKILELEGKISRAKTDESVKKLERQLDDLFQGMSKKRISKSEYFLGAKNQLVKSKYYSRPTEMLARAFESYISHRLTVQSEGKSSPGNEFIAMPEEAYALKSADAIDNKLVQDFVKRYPKENERLLIFEKFSELFHALQENVLEGVAADPDNSPMTEWTPLFEQKQNNNPLSKEAWKEHGRNLRVTQRAFEKTQEQPLKHPDKSRAERWWIALEDGLIHPWMGTKYGTLLSMMRRYKVKKDEEGNVITDKEGNVITTRAYKAILKIFKKIGIEPGGEISTSNVYPEAVRREVRRLSYAFKTMVDRHDGFLFNKQEENDLRLLLTSDPRTITKAMKGEMSPKVLKLAGELRNLLNKMYHYVKKTGVNIDYLESNAYLPRILDIPKVFANQQGFIQQAYNLYSEVIWIDQEGDFDGSEEQLMSVGSIANQKKFKISDGIKLITPPHLDPIVRNFKNVKERRKEIDKMKMEDADPEAIEKAELSLAEYMAKNQDVIEEGYHATRKDWSVFLAADWNHRIHQMAGEDPSASSPMANFTKKRVMPKEADSYMIDYYTDPIDAIGKYITGAVRKAEYTKRFGRHLIPPGKKRFAVTKQLQDYLDYLFREGMAGEVDPQDVQNMRTDIDAILGRTPPTDMGLKKTLNTAHSYALMGMLTRAVLTSIPEPFVAGIKMHSSLKGLKVFGLTMQEALTYVSKDVEQTVQKRRQIANILGLLDDPSVGEMASNRAGGTMMDDPKNQGRMNLWFVRVGLQGLTNAQRRATMAVSFQYLKEMGMQFLAPVGFSEQAVKDNKKEAELVLLDLGIPPDQMEDFATYMNDITLVKGLPDPEVLMTQHGDLTTMSELLAISSGRIVERSIQDPLIGNRPRYAEHPLGKFVYSIQSFNYSFQQNVIVGEAKHIKKIYKHIGSKRAALVTSQLLGPIFQLYVAHALVSAFREFLMNRERWEEKKEEGKLGSHIAGMTVSRAGTFGGWDPMVNAYTGLRYQRDLSNFMIGAIGSWYTKPTEDIIKLFSGDTNSPNTTATEERAIRAAYQLAIVPMMVFAISNPKFLSVLGPLAGPTAGAIAMFGTSHTVKKAVSSEMIKFLYGSKGDMSYGKRKAIKATKAKKSK